MPRTPNDVKKLAKDAGAKIVDLRFIDLPGMVQHFSIPVEDLEEELFTEGIGFDGSSIRGFQQIHESDMLLIADAESAVMDPVLSIPTLDVICNVFDPITRKPYTRDPRYVAQKAEAYLKKTGIADTSYWGPEAEFYIFDSVRYDQTAHSGYYYVDSVEGIWNSGRDEGTESRLQAAPQGRLLPGAALRSRCRTSARRSSLRCAAWGCPSRCTITKWEPPANARSTCASALCSKWRTT